jgi:hypothetical protein
MRAVLLALLIGLLLGACNGDDEPNSAAEFLSAASDAMAGESFSFTQDCPNCSPAELFEFAPPHSAKLSHGSGHDAWPYALILDGQGYLSGDGKRWLTGQEALEFLNLTLLDPRVLLNVTQSPERERDASVDGTEVVVIAGDLDVDAYLDRLLPTLLREAEARSGIHGLLDGTGVRFWIDRESHRVVQMELTPAGEDSKAPPVRFRYGEVGMPTHVESMDGEEAHKLGQEAEPGGERMLLAIAEYRAAHGAYPAVLDQTTLAGVLPANEWPMNPFSGQPMRQSPETPGDFDYELIAGREHMQFTLYGWDGGQLHYDSQRWGHQDPAEMRQRLAGPNPR